MKSWGVAFFLFLTKWQFSRRTAWRGNLSFPSQRQNIGKVFLSSSSSVSSPFRWGPTSHDCWNRKWSQALPTARPPTTIESVSLSALCYKYMKWSPLELSGTWEVSWKTQSTAGSPLEPVNREAAPGNVESSRIGSGLSFSSWLRDQTQGVCPPPGVTLLDKLVWEGPSQSSQSFPNEDSLRMVAFNLNAFIDNVLEQ